MHIASLMPSEKPMELRGAHHQAEVSQ